MELPRAVRTGRQEEMSNSAVVAQKNPFGLRIGWQVKITTDDIDDISSVEENISHSCELGSTAWIVGASDSSDAIVNRNDPPRRNRCAGSVTRNGSRCATFVAMVQTTHLWEGAKQGLSRASAHTATVCRHAPHRRSTNADLGSGRGRPFRGPSGPHFPNIK